MSTTPSLFQRKLIFYGWLWFSRIQHCNPTQQQSYVYCVCVTVWAPKAQSSYKHRRYTCGQCCSLMCADVTSAETLCVRIYEPSDLKTLRCPTWKTKEGIATDSFRKSESSRFDPCCLDSHRSSLSVLFQLYFGFVFVPAYNWLCPLFKNIKATDV